MGILSPKFIDPGTKSPDNRLISPRSIMALVALISFAVSSCIKPYNKTEASKVDTSAVAASSSGDPASGENGDDPIANPETVAAVYGNLRLAPVTPEMARLLQGIDGPGFNRGPQFLSDGSVVAQVSSVDVVKEAKAAGTFGVDKKTDRKGAVVKIFKGAEAIFRKCPAVTPVNDLAGVSVNAVKKQIGAVPIGTPIIDPTMIARTSELEPGKMQDGGDFWGTGYSGDVGLLTDSSTGMECMKDVRRTVNENLRAVDCCIADNNLEVAKAVLSREVPGSNGLAIKAVLPSVACDKDINPRRGVCGVVGGK